MARLIGKVTLSQNEVSQEIDLKRYLKRVPTESDKEKYAELAVERINERTLDGITIHGKNFAQYSEAYAERKGVTRDSVDLFLEGDMLDSLAYDTEKNSSKLKIIIDGDLETKKGYNHHVGDTLPKRPWFGVTSDEIKEIASKIKPSRNERIVNQERMTLSQLKKELDKLGLEIDDGDS